LVELVVLAVRLLVPQVQVHAFHLLGLVEPAEHQYRALAVSAVSAVQLRRRQAAPPSTLAPKLLVALVEWAEPLPSGDAAALGASPSPMAMRLQPQLVAMEELAEA
jgi:hypothetical protein